MPAAVNEDEWKRRGTLIDTLMTEARLAAFKILQRHPECLRDDVPLQDLIEDIAQAIAPARYFDTAK